MRRVAYVGVVSLVWAAAATQGAEPPNDTERLTQLLKTHGFTGKVGSSLEQRLGRPIDEKKKELGRFVFFDKHLGLHRDNSCAGCHSPTHGLGDTQPIAIGVDSNDVVGVDRRGARNQRRTPSVVNTAFYPKLMWNGRFSSNSGDPFDNAQGFSFPLPEDGNLFPAGDARFKHLLVPQAFIPFTEQPEMAGFTTLGNRTFLMPKMTPGPGKLQRPAKDVLKQRTLNLRSPADADSERPDFSQFDDGHGRAVPNGYPDTPDLLSNPIRHAVLEDVNSVLEYRRLFGEIYPSVKDGNTIEFWMIGQALAEFQLAQTFADAPIDKFARGEHAALGERERRGAILFFDKARCVTCHAVAGKSNEMFSDFQMHVAGVPQLAPVFGKDKGNVAFRNAQKEPSNRGNHDLGLWEFTNSDDDVYKFRTSPLRNLALQPAFFHNGAFKELEKAVRYHTNTVAASEHYDPAAAGVPEDLRHNIGPRKPVIDRLDPALRTPLSLTDAEVTDLVAFLKVGLLDERAKPDNLMSLVPAKVPSGARLQRFVRP